MKELFKTAALFSLLLFANTLFAQEDKLVELTTTGTGKTKDIAVHTALRSAIEQAFGVFISSKAEVLNDELLTDQIISVSNGNIQHYDIISEMPIDDNTNFAVTVKSKVSISKLTSFIESKGIEVEFKGAVFAMNIKQQKLNEESELRAIEEMASILKNIADHSFDFEVAANGEPTANANNTDKWDIPLIIKIKLNKNFENYKSYFQKTLSAITMTEAEANNYINLKKTIYSVMIRNQTKIVDTLLVKSKVKSSDVIKSYLLDSLNYLQIGTRDQNSRIGYMYYNQKSLATSAKESGIKTEKYFDLIFGKNGIGGLDTLRLKVISSAPLYEMYYLRNKKSSVELQKLIFYFVHSMQNFILDDGTKKSDFTSILNSSNKRATDYWSDVFNVTSVQSVFTDYDVKKNSPVNLWCSLSYGKKISVNDSVKLKELRPYNEENMDDSNFPTLNDVNINSVSYKFDLRERFDPYVKLFMESGGLFNPIFPGISTIQYNYNENIRNSAYNIVLQFNQLCSEDNIVATIKFNDEKSLDELNKLKGYKIYSKK
jgi:hypothetical protein